MEHFETQYLDAKPEGVGVDWLTATRFKSLHDDSFRDLGHSLISEAEGYGNEKRNWKGQGYHGLLCGGVVVATRADTDMIKLSSEDARDHWRKVAELSTNISRLDLQITFRLRQPRPTFITEQRERAVIAKKGRGRRGNITLIQSTLDGDSLYLGKRSSDVYARCYDKGKELKQEKAGVLIRQELEYKRGLATEVATRLARSESEMVEAALIVSGYMEGAGLQTMSGGARFAGCARDRTVSHDAKRRWIKNAVAPSVATLIRAGLLSEVIDDLGLSEYVKLNDERED